MSTSAPGYELTSQVPPNSEFLSNSTKSLQCFFCKRIAARSPETPVPRHGLEVLCVLLCTTALRCLY